MKKYKYLLYIVVAVIFVFFGLIVSKGTLITFLILLLLLIISFVVLITAVIIDLIRNSNHYKKVGFILIYLIIILISAVVFKRIEDFNKEKAAKLIIIELNLIKEKEGKYPSNLDRISAISLFPEINYSIDTLNQVFNLWYEKEGWNMTVYFNESDEGIIAD